MRTSAKAPATVYEDESLRAYGPARATIQGTPLAPDELRKTDAYWQASLYLCLLIFLDRRAFQGIHHARFRRAHSAHPGA